MEVKSPAVVKLFGEHAVVYGRLAVAAAVEMYATAKIADNKSTKLRISIPKFNVSKEFDQGDLKRIYRSFNRRKSIVAFISENRKIPIEILPAVTIAARLWNELNIKVIGKDIEIVSEIPVKIGCASSAACSAALTVGLVKASNKMLSDETIIDIARDGERILHINEEAGKIDVSTTYYGGYVSYIPSIGAVKEDINLKSSFVIINTGPKKSTAETVSMVSKLYKSKKQDVEMIFDSINGYSLNGLVALKNKNVKNLGKLMFENHTMLDKLGVSTKKLNTVVSLARSYNAYGAKLSGGGGGGVAIAITEDPTKLKNIFEKNGFHSSIVNVSLNGSSNYLTNLGK